MKKVGGNQKMKKNKWFALAGMTSAVLAFTTACGGGAQQGGENGGENGGEALSGNVVVDGSSTVYPIVEAAAEAYAGEQPDVKVSVGLSYTKLMIYGALIAVGYPILLVPYLSLTFDVIGQSNHAKEWRIEYIVMRELFLNGGRATSVLLFLLAITLFDAKEAIPLLMLIVGSGHFIIYFFVRRIRLSM